MVHIYSVEIEEPKINLTIRHVSIKTCNLWGDRFNEWTLNYSLHRYSWAGFYIFPQLVRYFRPVAHPMGKHAKIGVLFFFRLPKSLILLTISATAWFNSMVRTEFIFLLSPPNPPQTGSKKVQLSPLLPKSPYLRGFFV